MKKLFNEAAYRISRENPTDVVQAVFIKIGMIRKYNGTSHGIPYIVDYSAQGAATNRLLVVEAEYDDPETAVADMQAEGKLNYLPISRELFSSC